ncbi:hypothetical protein DYH09_05935 [bacterium CPR1]|nr:hypothetical protein [bacterium CPR1]
MILFGWLAWLGLLASLAVHLSTFFPGGASAEWPGWFVLHLGVFVVFFPAVLMVVRRGLRKDLSWLSPLARTLLLLAFLYAFVNFGFVLAHSLDGSPATLEGRRVLRQRGSSPRGISEQEYEYRQRLVVRGFSGHWIIFYLFSILALTAGQRRSL